MPEHYEIGWIERTGYPSWCQEREDPECDEDRAYEERADRFFDEL